MSLTLLLNGSPAPSTFQVGSQSQFSVLVNGTVAAAVEWSYGVRSGPRITGTGGIAFVPLNAEPHYLHVAATGADGTSHEAVFILSVTATGASALNVLVEWADPAPSSAGSNSATIHVSGVMPPRSIAWTHYLNGVALTSGIGRSIPTEHFQPGIHRIFATVVDAEGNTVVGDSSIYVPAPFGLQAAIAPSQHVNNSLVLLGSVYSPVIESAAALATCLPFLLASFEGAVKLIPGSTHFVLDLDPNLSVVDDEVIVRTQLGNWTLKGPPSGLTAENLPYDYQHDQPIQPAPLDLSAHYAIDLWNVHGASVEQSKFRVRFRCFVSGDPIYRYTAYDWSGYVGGKGERQRRLLALPTSVDLSLDDETPQNRLGSRDVETFTVPEQTFIVGNLSASGAPDRPVYAEDHFYTDQNTAAVYESAGSLADIKVYGTYGIPAERSCVLDFSQHGSPRIVNKPKRLWGKLLLYVSGGALTANTIVTVRVYTGKAPGYVDVPILITDSVYNPDYTGFLWAGEAVIDITDFEFNRLGVVMDFQLDESSARHAVPAVEPVMPPSEPYFYSKVNAPAIRVDTACFKNPVLVPIFEGTFLGSAVPLPDCNIVACGPVGTYCYVEVGGTGTFQALQPLGFPAPFVAPYADSVNCYGNPTFLGEYFGAETEALEQVLGFTGTTGCGIAYQYNPCSIEVQQQLAVVFPKNTVPHSAVSYQNSCYAFVGTVGDTSRLTAIMAADVTPVTGCTDVLCTGSNFQGGSVDYFDQETLQQVTVSFPHFDKGLPFFAVAGEKVSSGYGVTPPGGVSWTISSAAPISVMTATETAVLNFTITPRSIWRELVVLRAGAQQRYRFYPGLNEARISLQAGDVVTLNFGKWTKLYSGISGQVSWYKQVPLPFLYGSAAFTMPSSTGTLLALGFCGRNSRQDYTFYGTLGATAEMDLPNPDSIVTVKDTSSLPEMLLVQTKQPHELQPNFNFPNYQAQQLVSPLTFKFYAGRNRAGAHGEMDVWLDTNSSGTFPPYFIASEFKSLALIDSPYRKISQQSDTSRRGLRVALADPSLGLVHSPRVHVDDRGSRISVATAPLNDYIYIDGQSYTFAGVYDTGISETIYRNQPGGGGPELSNQISLSSRPRGLCYVSTTDEVWVACPDASAIIIFSGDGLTQKTTVTVTDTPYSVAHCVDTDCVAVACQATGHVILIDAATRNQVADLDIGLGSFYSNISMLASYNPISRNIYVAGVPVSTWSLTLFEVDPRTSIIRAFNFGQGAVSLADLFYCPGTLETIAAAESGGSFAFNVNTKIAENLGLPLSTCNGACAAPEIARLYFTSGASPGAYHYMYDPRSRHVTRRSAFAFPVGATGWHPLRRKFYLAGFTAYYGTPGVAIEDINGNLMLRMACPGQSFQWVYSPISKRMFVTLSPYGLYGNNVAVYS